MFLIWVKGSASKALEHAESHGIDDATVDDVMGNAGEPAKAMARLKTWTTRGVLDAWYGSEKDGARTLIAYNPACDE
jgi:hypothetical protein